MAFQFRFQALSNQRKFRRDQAQGELGQARRVLAELEQQRAIVRNAKAQQQQILAEREKKGISLNDFLVFQDGMKALERQLHMLEGRIRKAIQALEKKNKQLL